MFCIIVKFVLVVRIMTAEIVAVVWVAMSKHTIILGIHIVLTIRVVVVIIAVVVAPVQFVKDVGGALMFVRALIDAIGAIIAMLLKTIRGKSLKRIQLG